MENDIIKHSETRKFWGNKLFDMINPREKYQPLPDFEIHCREVERLKGTNFYACVHTFCSFLTILFG